VVTLLVDGTNSEASPRSERRRTEVCSRAAYTQFTRTINRRRRRGPPGCRESNPCLAHSKSLKRAPSGRLSRTSRLKGRPQTLPGTAAEIPMTTFAGLCPTRSTPISVKSSAAHSWDCDNIDLFGAVEGHGDALSQRAFAAKTGGSPSSCPPSCTWRHRFLQGRARRGPSSARPSHHSVARPHYATLIGQHSGELVKRGRGIAASSTRGERVGGTLMDENISGGRREPRQEMDVTRCARWSNRWAAFVQRAPSSDAVPVTNG